MIDDPLICYVLMRRDVPDYNSGKAMAQANHAGTHFASRAMEGHQHGALHHFRDWLAEGGGFGTCIVKTVTRPEMFRATEQAHLGGIFHGIVHDPSFPICDGDQIQTLPVDTCAYIFGRKSRCWPIVGEFPLFREPETI